MWKKKTHFLQGRPCASQEGTQTKQTHSVMHGDKRNTLEANFLKKERGGSR